MKKVKYRGKSAEERKLKRKEYRKKRNDRLIQERKNSIPSTGEMRIIEILRRHEFDFCREYVFSDLINPQTGAPLFFDFYLPGHNAIIEYDGPHHFTDVYGKAQLKYQRQRDRLKNRYCKRRQILLLRIPYWEADPEGMICAFFDKFWI